MKAQRKLILDRTEVLYIRSQIDSGDNRRIKEALQALCKFYRLGMVVTPDQRFGLLNTLVGISFRKTIDEKVRRWLLNALARVGEEDSCLPAVLHLISNHPDEPQTIASGIAATYKLCTRSDPKDRLAGISFDPQMRTLAALQHLPPSKLDLSDLPLDVERANSDLLKLALVVVGLDRSPDNLLNPRHTDAEMVKVLGSHHDPIVSQYSVWAITENKKLSLLNLGLRLADIESYPENVRSWLFQLIALEATPKQSYWEYVEVGMMDPSSEARRGLAIGLRDNFIDIFERWVLDWVAKEEDADVRHHLMDHIVRQSHRSPNYEQFAVEVFDCEPAGSSIRERMEASAIGRPIYTRLKQIGAGAADLFERSVTVVKSQINIQNLNAGAVAFEGGTAINQGGTNVQLLSATQIRDAQAELAKLEAAVHANANLQGEQRQELLERIAQAKQAPSQVTVGKVIEYLGHLGSITSAGVALAPAAAALGKILGVL